MDEVQVLPETQGSDEALRHSRRGIALVGQGRLIEALASFEEAVRLCPEGAGAHNDLGNALRLIGRFDEAHAHFVEAVRLRPGFVEAHLNMGLLFASRQRWEEASACFRQAIRLRPDAEGGHRNLAALLAALGRKDEASAYARQVAQLRPDRPETYFNLGATLLALRLFDEAAACFRHVLGLLPDDPATLNNLGTALWELGRLDEAEAHYRQALRLRPDDPNTLNNLGNALWEQGRTEEASAIYREALRLRPDSAEMRMNLGVALSGEGNLDEALAEIRQALRLRPDWPSGLLGLGMTLGRQGKLDEALDVYEQALRLQPDYPEVRRNRAMAWLARGDFARGWPEYRWRWKCRGQRWPLFDRPVWEGEDLSGRTILLIAEQGMGDTLQFIRYAPLVKQRVGKVVMVCPDPLVRLLARTPGVDQVVARGSALPEFDVYAPLLDLPAILGTTLETIPAEIPYLFADPEEVDRRRHELGPDPAFRIGIAWQGNPRYPLDRKRSFPLARFAPLARRPGVRLISLQNGPGTEQLRTLDESFPVLDLDRQGRGLGDFLDTSAVLKNLDLVVSPDLSVAHLAGGLGVRVWLALPFVAEWRWLADRDDSPWYPSMRLFRQSRPDEWDEVFRRITNSIM
jgi:tetratricopeptide (TPR) repeat protein